MLHRTSKVRGFHIHATDGVIGHVDDFLVDEQSWAVRYLVIDTSNWIGGRSVVVSPDAVKSVDAVKQTIHVGLTRAQIQASPSKDTADIVLAENLPAIWIM